MSDEIKLSKKARSLISEYDIAKRKGDRKRIENAALAIRSFAKNQKDAKVRAHLMQVVGSDDMQAKGGGGRGPQRHLGGGFGHGPKNIARRDQPKADPSLLGEPFHNPFTFLPFSESASPRRTPTLLTADEEDSNRLTGVLDLKLFTESPLVSTNPHAREDERSGHREYAALTIGDDVIVPATGVRGALRNLMTIITGSSLITLDSELYACQGRDAQLGPRGKTSLPNVPESCFLARVVKPGSRDRSGLVELGDTRLYPASEIASAVARMNGDLDHRIPKDLREQGRWANEKLKRYRPTDGSAKPLWIVESSQDDLKVFENPVEEAWELKLSGRPIQPKGKKEGAFHGSGEKLELPAKMWSEYNARHRHTVKEGLRPGDLVWLEPASPTCVAINEAADVSSIQWARWGRHGLSYAEIVPDHVRPSTNAEVDIVADLFGQVADDSSEVRSFAGRIRPENVVFEGAKTMLKMHALPPLSAPHPGCAAFYRWHGPVGTVSADEVEPGEKSKKLRGYKVYRTTQERGAKAPWNWSQQPIFDGAHAKDPKQKLNKSVELLDEGKEGRLRIAFRSLSAQEFGLLVLTCQQPWRLGGGKPLGLGLCRLEIVCALDEFGDAISLPDISTLPEEWATRASWWAKSQQPVPFLRYPRAAERNRNKINRGGHSWFQLAATPEKEKQGRQIGLETRSIHGDFARIAGFNLLGAQPLPVFDPEDPLADVLYGYDVIGEKDGNGRDKRSYSAFKPFDSSMIRNSDRSGGNQSYNREKRRKDRDDR